MCEDLGTESLWTGPLGMFLGAASGFLSISLQNIRLDRPRGSVRNKGLALFQKAVAGAQEQLVLLKGRMLQII